MMRIAIVFVAVSGLLSSFAYAFEGNVSAASWAFTSAALGGACFFFNEMAGRP